MLLEMPSIVTNGIDCLLYDRENCGSDGACSNRSAFSRKFAPKNIVESKEHQDKQ